MKKMFSVLLIIMLFSLFSCSDKDNNIKEVELVQLSDFSVFLYEGQTYQLSSSVVPSDAVNSALSWTSSSSSVCSVEDGLITALSEGVSVVTAKTENGKAASVRVTVKKIEDIDSIILSDLELSLEPGESHTLTASARPRPNSAALPIVWSSTDESVATVDANGKVTAKAKGACLIKADIASTARAVCKVSVSGIDMDLTSIVNILVDGLPKAYSRLDSYGNVVAEAEITSYEVERELTADGKITLTLKVYGNKTFDAEGLEGDSAVFLKAALYEILPEGEKYKGYYACTSGYVRAGETFELGVISFYDQMNQQFYTGNEIAFNADINQQQRTFKVVLDYGEEDTQNEYD